jgi:isovaleryl-CoA dehydrogenase
MQGLGGWGYCDEFKVERFLRDAKLLEIGGGLSRTRRTSPAT